MITKTRYINGNKIEFTSENLGGGYLDTTVTLNGNDLCVIPYDDIDNFVNDLNDLLSKYSI